MRTKEYIHDAATGLFHPLGHFFKNGIKGPAGYHAAAHSRLVGDQNHLETGGVQKGNGVRTFGDEMEFVRMFDIGLGIMVDHTVPDPEKQYIPPFF